MGIFEDVKLELQDHPSLTLASPFNILWEYDRGPQKSLKGDIHYALQISIVMQGEVEVVFGDWSRVFQRGELWWTMCWEPHAYRLLAPRNFVMSVNINIDNLGNCGPFSDVDWLVPFTVKPQYRFCPSNAEERGKMAQFSRELFHAYNRKNPNWQTHCWLMIHQLILRASEKVSSPGQANANGINAGMSRIQKAVSLVRTAQVPPSLEAAARCCSLSVSRFSYLFRSTMGVSYGQFSLHVRLTNAANEVRSGIYTLSEIAERHGFCDASSFCHAFRKVYRCTPNEFKMRK